MKKMISLLISGCTCCLLLSILLVLGAFSGLKSLAQRKTQKTTPPQTQQQSVTNFKECTLASGAVVMESYPRQCKVDGKTFAEDLTETYMGTLKRIARPSPEIPFDYSLDLISPPETHGALNGGSGLPQKSIIIVPNNDVIGGQLKLFVGKKVSVSGTPSWGFAETDYLDVTKVEAIGK